MTEFGVGRMKSRLGWELAVMVAFVVVVPLAGIAHLI